MKNRRKLLNLFVSVAVVLVALLGLSACEEEHTHSFTEWETVAEPTCTAFGIQKRTCECSYEEHKTLAALPHTPVTDAAVDATCTSAGKTEGSHCDVCKAVIVPQTATAPIAHSYSEWETLVAPTCTSFGIQKHTCECGYVEYQTTAAVEHTPVTDAAVDATCTSAGKTEGSHCDVCKAVIVPQTATAPIAHSYSEWGTLVAPTCTSFGLQKRTCKCGYAEYQTLAALQHTPVTDAAIDATCTTDGKTEGSHCDTCGTVLTAQNTVCAFGHNFDKVTVLTEADCNVEGSKRFACSNDGCTCYYDESYTLDELSSIEIMEAAKEYVGCIKTYAPSGVAVKDATAIVVSSDGILLTSYSALNHASYVTFTLGETTYDVVSILAYDKTLDVAVLKIDATDLATATLCDSQPVTGEKVYSIGNALGTSFAINEGLVSNASTDIANISFIHHNADLVNGFGGGPLVNRFGEVIGINLGYYKEKEFRVALPIAKISELNFDDPITTEENFNLTYTTTDYLIDWITAFATSESSNSYYVEHGGSRFKFSFGYNKTQDYLFIESVIIVDDGSEVFTHLPLVMMDDGTYQYYVNYSNNVFTSEIIGYYDPATYGDPNVADSTKLTYDTFYGRYQSEEIIMNECSYCVYETLGWFSYWLNTYFFEDINLKDTFGFEVLSFKRDETALDKLNSFVYTTGAFDPNTGLYSLDMSQNANNSTYTFVVSYRPESEGVASETTVSIRWVAASGTLQEVSIVLNSNESGNRFDMTAATWNGTEFELLSQGWGYIDANSFTDTTPLTCYVIEGYEEYEDLLLGSCASLMSYLLDWTNHVIAYVEPGLSIRDLGFLFYFLP